MATETKIVISAVDNTKDAIASAINGIKSLSSAIGGIPGFGPLMASLSYFASFSAFKSLVADTISWGAEMQRASLRTGASVEALGALGKVAKLTQTDIGSVEASLIRLSKSLSGADEESNAAGRAISAIGLHVEELRSKDPANAMLDIAKSLSNWADDGNKVATVLAILGKNGAEMLPMLKDLATQTDLNGKLTQKQAEMAANMEKEWAKLTNTGSVFAKSLSLEILPSLNSVLEQMTAGTRIAGGFLAAFLEFGPGMSFATGGIEGTRKEIERLNRTIAAGRSQNLQDMGSIDLSGDESKLSSLRLRLEYQKFQQRQDALAKSGSAYEDPRDVLSRRLPSLPPTKNEKPPKFTTSKISSTPDDGSRLVEQLLAQVRGTMDLSEAEKLEIAISEKKYATATKGNLETARGYALLLDAIKANKTAEQEAAEAAKARADEYQRIFDATRTPLENLNAELDHLLDLLNNGTLGDGAAALELFGRAAQKAGEKFQSLTDKAEKDGDVLEEFAKSAARNMQSAFADFLFDPFQKGTKSMLQSFGDTVRRMIAEASSAQLMKYLFGDIAGKSGGSLGGLLGAGMKALFGGGTSGAGSAPALSSDALIGVIASGSFAVGTDYVPYDMLAQIHRGERIVPAAQNRQRDQAGHSISVVVNMAGNGSATDVRRAGGSVAREVLGAIRSAGRYR